MNVYSIISEKDKRIYVGISKDPFIRLKEHNSGKTRSTKAYRPWILFYIESGFENVIMARKREKFLKNASGKRYLRNVLDKFDNEIILGPLAP